MYYSILKKFFLAFSPIGIFTVAGQSMEPTLSSGTKVITATFSRIHKGDIVVFKKPSTKQLFIKRVDKIRPISNKTEYYVVGDNKNKSTDSRDFGWIAKKDIIGKVIYLMP